MRLVTITGPGGVGKTRLAQQVARDVCLAFRDGVWYVRLSQLTNPKMVIPTIAQALDLKERGATPYAELLRERLRDRRTLLVLDNFEHVIEAAPSVGTLLEHCAGVTALVTSRSAMRLRGEHAYTIHPLALPNVQRLPPHDQLTTYAAPALFVERVRAAQPDFGVTPTNARAIAEICARLDGLPLAIELAAAHVKVLPPEALLARLSHQLSSRLSSQLMLLTGGARDADERQQTMRATIAWSEGLLSPAERMLFRRLAVFAGGCSLEAAEAVCGAPTEGEPLHLDVFDGLSALVDHSLLQQRVVGTEGGGPRFGMLHVVREYAQERLEVSGEAEALRRAHMDYLLALIEPVNFRQVRGRQGPYWLARLDREQDNVRAALAWALARGHEEPETLELGLRLADANTGYWFARGHSREPGAWHDALLAARPADAPLTATFAWVLGDASCCAANQGDLERGVTLMEQALTTARAVGDRSAIAVALQILGGYALQQGQTARGIALLNESLVEARQLDDVDCMLNTLVQTAGCLLLMPGEVGRVVALAEETITLSQQAGKPYYESYARRLLSYNALERGDVTQAEWHACIGLRLACDQDLLGEIVNNLESVAFVAARQGHAVQSAHLLGAAAAQREVTGTIAGDDEWSSATEALVAPIRAELGEEAWVSALEAGRALSLDDAITEALTVAG